MYLNGYTEILASKRVIDTLFVNANRFILVGGKKFYDMDTGELKFSHSLGGRREQRRVANGWCFAHESVVLSNTVKNLEQALHRLIAVRKGDRPGHDECLRDAQRLMLRQYSGGMRLWMNEIDSIEWYEDMIAQADELVPKPHPKKQLRMKTWKECHQSGLHGQVAWLRRTVTWKLKCMEWARFGKIGRIIVDLGTPASLQGGVMCEKIKLWQSIPRIHRDCYIQFIKKSTFKELKVVFDTLLHSSYRFLIFIFSDDAMACVYDGKNRRWLELDISSCDKSHTEEMFMSYFDVCNVPSVYRCAFREQMMANIVVRNPEKPTEKIEFEPVGMYLQSGSGLTTSLNTHCWMFMFYVVAESDAVEIEDILQIFADCGYDITCEVREKFEQCTFLKHNPVLCSCCGVYQPVMNVGAILRASGVAKFCFPGKGDLTTKTINHQSCVMNGLLKGIRNNTLEALNPRTSLAEIKSYYVQFDDPEEHWFTDENLFNRYNFTALQIANLRQDILNVSQLGMICYSREADIIFRRDYGMGVPFL